MNVAGRLLRENDKAGVFWIRSVNSFKHGAPRNVRFKREEMNLNQVNASVEDDLLLKRISIKYVTDFESLREFVNSFHMYVPFNGNNNNDNNHERILILDDFDELTNHQSLVETFKLLCVAKEALGLRNETFYAVADEGSLKNVRLVVCAALDRAEYFESKACFSIIFNNTSTKIEHKKPSNTFYYTSKRYSCTLTLEEHNEFVEQENLKR